MATLYLKSHRRRPVFSGRPGFLQDRQALPPAAWCPLCGGEIYEQAQRYCLLCRKETKE